MTSLSPAPRLRSPRLPWVLLVLSVALNLFFVGSVVWLHMHNPHRPQAAAERAEWVARQLVLTEDQRREFDSFIGVLRTESHAMHETNMPLINQVWDEFGKAEPDQAAIDQLLQQADDHRREYRAVTGKALRSFLAVLSPEQRATMVRLLKERPRPDMPPLLRQLAP